MDGPVASQPCIRLCDGWRRAEPPRVGTSEATVPLPGRSRWISSFEVSASPCGCPGRRIYRAARDEYGGDAARPAAPSAMIPDAARARCLGCIRGPHDADVSWLRSAQFSRFCRDRALVCSRDGAGDRPYAAVPSRAMLREMVISLFSLPVGLTAIFTAWCCASIHTALVGSPPRERSDGRRPFGYPGAWTSHYRADGRRPVGAAMAPRSERCG